MRIAIDCSHHRIPGGIRTYIGNLLPELIRAEPGNELVLYHRGLRLPEETVPLPVGISARTVLARGPRRLLSFAENRLGVPWAELATGPVDVFHGTHFILPPTRRARRILTVHDVAYLRDPGFYRDRRYGEYGYRYLLGHALRRADLVLAISRATREDVLEFFPVEPDRVWVVHCGVDPRFAPMPEAAREPVLQRLGIGRPFVLYPVGTFEPRKNVPRALEAFAAAFPGRGDRPLLVLTGMGPEVPAALELASRLGLGDDVAVRAVSYPDELAALMSGALWGMYLSLYEGFGLPPLECMACGLPLVASDRSSIPEVVGEDAHLVDPGDTESIAAGLRRLHGDPGLRADLRARGLRRIASGAFSWARAARQVLAAYRLDRGAFDAAAEPGITAGPGGC